MCICVCACGSVFEGEFALKKMSRMLLRAWIYIRTHRMNNLVEVKRFCPSIRCRTSIKQDVESTHSTVMLFNGMYVDRSEPIGTMPVLLHLLRNDMAELM